LPPILALRSTGRALVTPLALPVRHGVSTYSTALFARADAWVGDAGELRRARAAWVDPQSAAGYLVIRALLRSRGMDLTELFGENTFYGSHEAVVEAVFDGRADVGATFVHEPVKSGGAQRAGWRDRDVRVLAMADSIPSDMLAARADLEPEIRGRLQDSLVGVEHPEVVKAATELFGAEAFRAPSQEHLDALTTILGELEEAPPSRRSALGGPLR
jgi:phosphonate transport system substrate-binding protein